MGDVDRFSGRVTFTLLTRILCDMNLSRIRDTARVAVPSLYRRASTYGVSVDDPSDARAGEASTGQPRARAAPTPPLDVASAGTDEPSLGKSGLLLDTAERVSIGWILIDEDRHWRPQD